ncbi:hypothetical protein [Labrys sp. 22185]|uniref:hypothetical protein n=1 Tax=Labrys sp. 22185 TaxID=3453888 RepID=UPI003F851D93
MMPAADEDRIFKSLEKLIQAFFEGHDVPPLQQSAYLVRITKAVMPEEPKPARKGKPAPSRVAIASQRDINRMWANHEKANRK